MEDSTTQTILTMRNVALVILAAATAVMAQLQIFTPASLVQCQPVLVSWQGGTSESPHRPFLALLSQTDRCRPVLCVHHPRWPDNGGGNVSPAFLLPLSSPGKPALGDQSSAESSTGGVLVGHVDRTIAEQPVARTSVRHPRPPSLGPSISPRANPSHSRLSTLPETSTTVRL